MGQVCFENQTGEDLFFVCEESAFGKWLSVEKIGSSMSARNCSMLITVNDRINLTATSRQANLLFTH
jgi:hypothetical protein